MLSVLTVYSCSDVIHKIYKADNSKIIYSGRVDRTSPGEVTLIGSASYATFNFRGDSCLIYLRNDTWNGLQNYIVLELDGRYLGRIRIAGDSILTYPVKAESNHPESIHHLIIAKATEAQNGYITFAGVSCEAVADPPALMQKSIEFIGNSITCGQGIESEAIPCNTDQWYDQHNAYLAYGPVVARKLNVNYMLSSVSGIGIYRNWNGVGPTMPMVYENRYLNTDSTKQWDFSQFNPDLVSICLGTNDFSDGDGIHERLPFDSEKFTSTYISFVQTVFHHYPKTKIVLLNSPMVSGGKNKIFIKCLKKVINYFSGTDYQPIELFEFAEMVPQGCDYHPGKEDHKKMAEQLYLLYKKILDK